MSRGQAPDDNGGAGAYRRGEVRPLCSVCGELAHGGCLRCSEPRCAAHGLPDQRRCDACEAAFDRRTRRWASAATLGLQLLVALPYLVVGRPSVDSKRWLERVRRKARPRFLHERPR
jgi:hypothetical protein